MWEVSLRRNDLLLTFLSALLLAVSRLPLHLGWLVFIAWIPLLQVFERGVEKSRQLLLMGLEAIQAYCHPFMSFSLSPSGDYGFWPDLEGLEYAARSKDGVIKVNAGDAWPPLWTPNGREVQFVIEVNDHGNVTLYNRRRQEVWSCI